MRNQRGLYISYSTHIYLIYQDHKRYRRYVKKNFAVADTAMVSVYRITAAIVKRLRARILRIARGERIIGHG